MLWWFVSMCALYSIVSIGTWRWQCISRFNICDTSVDWYVLIDIYLKNIIWIILNDLVVICHASLVLILWIDKVSSCSTEQCLWFWTVSVSRWCDFDLLFIHLHVCFGSCELHLIHGAIISHSLFFSLTCPRSFSPYPLFINSVTSCLLSTSFHPHQYSLLSSSLFP